ncbi:5'-nucleotidase C-terminal domain-containing protein [Vagococcus sp.]|uniref:5'-nucleotidase C-terminal domain-containing protein n=1 Tax=Vagococcus sp. TaxID=1933889 RepID=UPI000ED38ECF|nr:5'-nucleotidase C-terminal domain-containing protein [Vagococcus sp.]HCT95833.1 multifunctional 2',3'-cyclic-nucleotide 2'-phosphodiesterase/5'-nucleotidase/3'-nucleotidase [Vagococcus sp.]
MKCHYQQKVIQFVIALTLFLGSALPASMVLAEEISETQEPVVEATQESSISEEVVDSTAKEEATEKEISTEESVQATEESAETEVTEVQPTEEKPVVTDKKKLTILGTSDVHGNVWDYSYEDNKEKALGFARISTHVNNVRATNGAENVVVVDAGDNLQGTILTDDLYSVDPKLAKKHPVVTAMNHIGYDAMTLGNHEFNFGVDLIKSAKSQANFPYLSANTRYKTTGEYLVDPYKVVEKNGLNVAIIGLTIPHIHHWDPENAKELDFTPLKEEAQKQVAHIKENEKADVIIAVIHAGLQNSDANAAAINVIKEVPEIEAFILGHDHRAFAEKHADNTGREKPVGAVKDTGANVVKIDLELEKTSEKNDTSKEEDDADWEVKSSQVGLLNATDVQADEALKEVTRYAHEKTIAYTKQELGQALANFVPENEIPGIPEAQLRPTAMISLINNVQRKHTGAQIAAASLFKEDSRLDKGPIRYNNLFDIYKYANTLIKTEISGKNLKTYMEQQARYYQQFKEGDVAVAFNEKIRIYDYDMFSGVTYKIDISEPEGQRIKDLKLATGEAIQDDQMYSLAVNSHRFSGLVDRNLVSADKREDSDPDSLRGFIAEYIKDKKVLDPSEEIEESFELVGYEFDEDYRQAVIDEVKKGNIQVMRSADERTPNVKKLNVYDLIDEGKLDPSILKEDTDKDIFSFSIMHTNDMHGRFEYDKGGKAIGLAKVKTYKDQHKPTLLVDAGDAIQGLPISNHTKGADMVKAMNAVGYDAMTLGNHEFDFGMERALELKEDFNFPIVSANVYKDGTRPFDPYVIKKKEGINFALIGLTTPETTVKTHPNNVKGVTFKKPVPVAKEVIDEIGNKADVFVFMTHLGIDETTLQDERGSYLASELSKAYPDKKIFIIDGHSHTELPQGKQEGHVLMGQTGNHLNNIGWIEAAYNPEADLSAQLITFADFESLNIEQDPAVKAIADEARRKYDEDMGDIVLENNPVKFIGERSEVRSRETNLGNIIGDAIFDYAQTSFKQPADFAVVNGGGIRQNINTGAVTRGDIVGVMPFGNSIAQIQVSGEQIYEMFEHSLRSDTVKDEEGNVLLDEKGMPRLGANGGFLHVSRSIRVKYDANILGKDSEEAAETRAISPEKRVWSIELQDPKTKKFVPVDRQKKDYYVATNDFLAAGGDGYDMLGGPRQEGPSMDTVFLEYLQNKTNEELLAYETLYPYERIIPEEAKEVDLAAEIAALKELIKELEALVKDKYTEESWKALVAALEKAKEELATLGEGISLEQVNELKAQLEKAKKELDALKENNAKEDNEQGKPAGSTSTGTESGKGGNTSTTTGKLPQTGEDKSNLVIIGFAVVTGSTWFIYRRKKQAA